MARKRGSRGGRKKKKRKVAANTKNMIYLDWNATTPIFAEVASAMEPYLWKHFGNPSSAHKLGRTCHEAVESARAEVSSLLGCDSDEIVFTSCGTEADNWVIHSAIASKGGAKDRALPHVVTTNIEHPAITECLVALSEKGLLTFTEVPVSAGEGLVSAREVVDSVRKETVLVTVMHSNNEVGSIQPVSDIARLLKEREGVDPWVSDVLFHTDAAQSVGKVALDAAAMPRLDLATVVGHKFGAPKGIGALFVKRGIRLEPFLRGGGQEGGRRAGTENILHIVGIGAAAALARREGPELRRHMQSLRDRLQARLCAAFDAEDWRVNGPSEGSLRLPNTLSISFKGLASYQVIRELSEEVACSAGAACHSDAGSSGDGASVSQVLMALDVPREFALGTLRLSVGRATTEQEVDDAADRLIGAIKDKINAGAYGAQTPMHPGLGAYGSQTPMHPGIGAAGAYDSGGVSTSKLPNGSKVRVGSEDGVCLLVEQFDDGTALVRRMGDVADVKVVQVSLLQAVP